MDKRGTFYQPTWLDQLVRQRDEMQAIIQDIHERFASVSESGAIEVAIDPDLGQRIHAVVAEIAEGERRRRSIRATLENAP